LEAQGDATMLDFDILCAYRLDLYERDCRNQLANRTAAEVISMYTGEPIRE